MNTDQKLDRDPVPYFNRWLKEPLLVRPTASVLEIMDELNRHEIGHDETAQDYIMPPHRYQEEQDEFRILGENQDTWHCFVRAGDELKPDPPVYFETCLDLKNDHGFADVDIIDGKCVMVCSRFRDFLWQMLGHQICLRLEGNGLYRTGVRGINVLRPVKLPPGFANPLVKDFPAGFTCYFSHDTICIPEWGAAFLSEAAEKAFVAKTCAVARLHWD